MFKTLLLSLVLTLPALTQATPPTCPETAPNTPYSYFASSGIGYDQFTKLPSLSEGFGVKTGTCSNGFLVTTITTGVGANNPNPGYALLTERYEYHLVHTNYFEFIGDGQVGVVAQAVNGGTVTTATFGGGAAISFDLGWLASRGKFHLPIVFHTDYVAAPNAVAPNSVKASYLLDFRKTF